MFGILSSLFMFIGIVVVVGYVLTHIKTWVNWLFSLTGVRIAFTHKGTK